MAGYEVTGYEYMSNGLEGLTSWFSQRPMWLQAATDLLLTQSELSDEDIAEIVTMCQQEADGKLGKTISTFPVSAFSQNTAGTLRLCSISDVQGINALAPSKPLEFGEGSIAVVYGSNGSGKSGYVRLLKHVCGAREKGTLHHNVYGLGPTTQKAKISFEKNGHRKTHTWSGQGICDDLSSVDIFDTSFGKVFVNSDDVVSYEPPILLFFTSLISVCDEVAKALENEVNRHPSKKPSFPIDKKDTPEGIWYKAISAKTSNQDIEQHCTYSIDDDVEVQKLQQLLAEKAPAIKAKQLRKQKEHIDALVQDAKKYLKQVSTENVKRIIAAKQKRTLKNEAAKAAAERVFSNSVLTGIGSDIWKELWKAARNYSVDVAYKEVQYPNVSDGSRCVLCHQTLSPEAKHRLLSFEDFVKGEIQKTATEAAKEYETACQTIEMLPTPETLKTRIDAAGISQDGAAKQVLDFFAQLQTRKDLLLTIESENAIPEPIALPKWIEDLNARSKSISEHACKYDKDAKEDNREEITKRLYSLQARKWLWEQREAIDKEIARLKLLDRIATAKKLTSTRALSQKKGDLAETLITSAFVKRFNTELRSLGASRVKVELVKSKVSKGQVLHKLQLRDAEQNRLTDVLSEGEQRIVSIAAFLADVTGRRYQAPFIFDDPVSSLDQKYEEAVVKRLLDLSNDKQVIVFTHRLSLLGTINHLAKGSNIKPHVTSIRSVNWGTGEPAPIPLSQRHIKATLNTLINDRYHKLNTYIENSEFEDADSTLKAMCSDFRILLERSIENDLLCGVVQRFQRPVNTLKIKKLSKLKEQDCEFLDSLMTKYSAFEHSQPVEAPVDLPDPHDLLNDMERLKNWRDEYIKREA